MKDTICAIATLVGESSINVIRISGDESISIVDKIFDLVRSSNGIKASEIAKQLKGFSNSSICAISKQAALNAMKRDRADISIEDYEKAIKETTEEKPDRTQYLSEAAGSKKIGF